MYAELGDKTFLLIIIFTMAWSTWHLKDHAEDEEIVNKQVEKNQE
jgi:hypothetical protein